MSMASTTANELYEKLMALPLEEQRAFQERLNARLDVADNDTSDELLAKIERRMSRIDRGEAKLIPASEAKAEVMRRLAERRR